MYDLDPRILERLILALRRHPEWLRTAELQAQIRTFQERFPADRLSRLQGEELLLDLHGRESKDSLVYWLEFKRDDSFRTKTFGSISGGSAVKFGIWQAAQDQRWYVRDGKVNRALQLSEAIAIAERHRDQLLAARRVVLDLPEDPSDDAYAALPERIQASAPDIHHLAFVHKYLFMQRPAVLDDFHSPDYQIHYLIELGLEPRGANLYHNAAPFVAAWRRFQKASQSDITMPDFTAAVGQEFGDVVHHWRIGTGGQGEVWPAMRDGGYIAIGWDALPDIETLAVGQDRGSDIKEAIRTALGSAYPNEKPTQRGKSTNQIWAFFGRIQEGDRVHAAYGQKIVGVGRVTGGYRYEEGHYRHRRDVEWLSVTPLKSPTKTGLQTTVYSLDSDHVQRLAVRRHLLDAPPKPPVPGGGTGGGGTTGKVPPLEPRHQEIQRELSRKGQVILYGPPGTGKTYHAVRAAEEITARRTYGKTWTALTAEQRKRLRGEEASLEQRIWTCTFHPAYGYEDFIEGLRPRAVPGGLTFDPKDGLLLRVCKAAARTPAQPHFLIIDELNRGDIPRIFGEVITLLEKDKREELAVSLPVSEQRFTIPANLMMLATMNTADRSIALLDTALRRRFGFLELMPEPALLSGAIPLGIPLDRLLEVLNRRILDALGKDARNLQIGHSFFMRNGTPLRESGDLVRVLRYEVVPLLQEYCYDSPEALGQILGNDLFDDQIQAIHGHLLKPDSARVLRDALISWDAEQLAIEEEDDSDGQDTEGEDA